jgi:hypothetical protein
VLDPRSEELGIATGRLVAVGEKDERRVVAVRLQDAARLAVEPLVDRQAAAEAGRAVRPGGHLDLVVEALLVRGREGGLWRAPGVEADHVEPMRLGGAHDAAPGGDVGRRVASLREDRALEGAAEEGLPAVDHELSPPRADLAQPEPNRSLVSAGRTLEIGTQDLEGGRELVPGAGFGAERDVGLE